MVLLVLEFWAIDKDVTATALSGWESFFSRTFASCRKPDQREPSHIVGRNSYQGSLSQSDHPPSRRTIPPNLERRNCVAYERPQLRSMKNRIQHKSFHAWLGPKSSHWRQAFSEVKLSYSIQQSVNVILEPLLFWWKAKVNTGVW